MTKIQIASLACALMLCLPGSAEAQLGTAYLAPSVKSIYEDCKGRNLEFCNGYLSGIAEGLAMLHTYNQKVGETYCPSHTVDPTIYRRIFMKWAEHSKFWNLNSHDGAVVAFFTEWFCPKTR